MTERLLRRFNIVEHRWRQLLHAKSPVPDQKKPALPACMVQTRAGTGDSVGRFRRHRWWFLINYDSNLSMCGTFLQKLVHLPEHHGLLTTQNDVLFACDCSCFEHLVISSPNIDLLYQRIVQLWVWFSQSPSPQYKVCVSSKENNIKIWNKQWNISRKISTNTSKYKINYCPGCLLFIHVVCLLWRMCVLFYLYFVCLRVCLYVFNSKVRCRSVFEPGASSLFTAHHVCAFLI